MIPFSSEEILQAVHGRMIGKKERSVVSTVSTDTRSIETGSLFCALRGVNFDGHSFVAQAFKKGASLAIIDELAWKNDSDLQRLANEHSLVIVPDVYRALGELASSYRARFNIPLVAITGSMGKTTTKECIAAVLRFQKNVCAGAGNLNNHIGLPLNMFRISNDHEVAVFEMGASAVGEIKYLSTLAKPSIGVVTCVRPAHLKGFGSLDAIYNAKLELADYLGQTGGVLVVGGDDPKLVKMAKERCPRVVTFGQASSNDYRVSGSIQDGEFLKFTLNEKYSFRMKGYGLFNINNAAAAIATADLLGQNINRIASQWNQFVSVSNRFQVEELLAPRVRIVKDCYNANPQAFSLAIQSFLSLSIPGKKIIVAGDMKELGEEAEKYHHRLGVELSESGCDFVVLIGEYAGVVAQALHERNYKIPLMQCSSNQQIAEFLRTIVDDGDAVLFKGSRSMRLEDAADILKHELAHKN